MKLQDQSFNISGTFNIQHMLADYSKGLLLPDGRADFVLDMQEHEMHTVGAPTFTHDAYEADEKGYGDEWYFKTVEGKTVAIGFRWGFPRLRGDMATTVEDVIELIDYLESHLRA